MNRTQRKVFDSIFKTPTLSTIKFSDIEKLIISLGAEVVQGSGSRVAFDYNKFKLFVHRPHLGKEARKYQVEAFREFLELAGFSNE